MDILKNLEIFNIFWIYIRPDYQKVITTSSTKLELNLRIISNMFSIFYFVFRITSNYISSSIF
jgi:hypothetical protein